MVDDRDRELSGDDMLRAAREEPASPESPSVEDSREPVESRPETTNLTPDSGPMVDSDRVETSMITSCGIRPPDHLWAKLTGKVFVLTVQGREVARITTSLKDSAFEYAASDRETRADFTDDRLWVIRAVEPGPRVSRTPIGDRIVTVLENNRPVAHTDGPLPPRSKDRTCTVVAMGTRFTLSPTWKARSGTIDEQATLRRDSSLRSQWSVTAHEPVPLSVVLLHWHLLLGDWKPESSRGDGAD